MADTKQNNEAAFLSWLSENVSAAQLSELYIVCADIENFCMQRNIIKKKLFALTDLADIRKVMNTIDSNKVFRFTYKKNLRNMNSAMRFYYRFVKEHPELLAQPAPMMSIKSTTPLETKPVESSLELVEYKETTAPFTVGTDVFKIDFTNIQPLTFTQPTEYSYFGEVEGKVNTWTQLYVQVAKCLLDDYPDVLRSYINLNIGGQGRYDFADESGKSSMTAPKKVQDNFYLETNISATDIARKIKKLLDICNVDCENLEVYYRGADSAKVRNVSVQRLAKGVDTNDAETIRKQFKKWLEDIGLAKHTVNNYAKAIVLASEFAQKHGLCKTELLRIKEGGELQDILDKLKNNLAFKKINLKHHRSISAAVLKFIEYRSNNPTMSLFADRERKKTDLQATTSAIAQPLLKTECAIRKEITELKAVEPVLKSQGLPEETLVRYAEILTEHFGENGYQTGRPIFRGRFKRFYEGKYGYPPTESDNRIDEIISMVGTKRDDRIFPKQDNSQSDLVMEIVNDILTAFDSGATAVYIEAVYDKYQQPLANNLHIYNQNALASLLLANARGKYIQRYSFLTNNRSSANTQEDLLRIMKTFHQPQDYTAIHEKAWFLPYKMMKNILVTTPSIVNVAAETYFYAPNLPVSADELAHLSSLINEELNYHSYISDVRLMQLIAEKYPSIALNTDGYTTYGLRNCLGYILRDQFAFNGPIITLKGKELTMADVFTEFAKDKEVLSVDELSARSNEMNIVIYWDSILSEMIRVSATELVRKDKIKFDIDAIDDFLERMWPGDYVPLPEVNLFLSFPNIGYPWNSFLLESYLFGFSRKFRLLHSSFIKTGVYGAMVRKDADFPDYRSILVDVLSKSNALDSAKEALQYIVDKGYQQRKRYEGIDTVIQEAKLVKEQRKKQEK